MCSTWSLEAALLAVSNGSLTTGLFLSEKKTPRLRKLSSPLLVTPLRQSQDEVQGALTGAWDVPGGPDRRARLLGLIGGVGKWVLGGVSCHRAPGVSELHTRMPAWVRALLFLHLKRSDME